MASHFYTAYGLNFESEIRFPELLTENVPADVVIRFGTVPPHLDFVSGAGQFYELNSEQCLLNFSKTAKVRFLIQKGSEIIVEKSEQAFDEEVRLFLLCSGMAAIFYQREMFPIHGSAIQTKKGSVIFCGASGVGKSTLAAAFCKRRYAFLADDICIIDYNKEAQPYVIPGFPKLKLWGDAAKLTGYEKELTLSVRPSTDKYFWAGESAFVKQPVPLRTIYWLTPAATNEITIKPYYGIEKIAPIQTNVYRKVFARQMGKELFLFQNALQIAQQVTVRQVTRPCQIMCLDELVDLIEKDLA